MKLTDEQFEFMQAFALLGREPSKLAKKLGDKRFFELRRQCREFYLLAGHDNRLRVTGFGAAMLVTNGYRGTLDNVVPRNRSNVRGKLKGNSAAGKRVECEE